MKASVILPTYNEADNIVGLVEEILRNFPSDVEPEILVVDDDSPDKTHEIAKNAGYTDVSVLPAGIKGWVSAGKASAKLPVG